MSKGKKYSSFLTEQKIFENWRSYLNEENKMSRPRKNKKFIDPRYFMDEKTEVIEEGFMQKMRATGRQLGVGDKKAQQALEDVKRVAGLAYTLANRAPEGADQNAAAAAGNLMSDTDIEFATSRYVKFLGRLEGALETMMDRHGKPNVPKDVQEIVDAFNAVRTGWKQGEIDPQRAAEFKKVHHKADSYTTGY